jgi:hypothetical protein
MSRNEQRIFDAIAGLTIAAAIAAAMVLTVLAVT